MTNENKKSPSEFNVGMLVKDRDGDLAEIVSTKISDNGSTWSQVMFRQTQRLAWMPDTFLTRVNQGVDMPLDAALEFADTEATAGGIMTKAALKSLAEGVRELQEQVNWQNWPNRREPVRGGYEFYINEEWTCIRDAALGEDPGFHASLMKVRFDPDDERVRVRRVLDDDAILKDLAEGRYTPRIYTRCPSCHKDTLTINEGHLLCTWHACDDPTLIDRIGETQ